MNLISNHRAHRRPRRQLWALGDIAAAAAAAPSAGLHAPNRPPLAPAPPNTDRLGAADTCSTNTASSSGGRGCNHPRLLRQQLADGKESAAVASIVGCFGHDSAKGP